MTDNASLYVIRKATEADVERIVAITDAAYEKYVPRIGRKPMPMVVDYAEIITGHDIWLLCERDSETPVALLVLENESDAVLIYSIAIQPELQGRGLGSWLMRFAEDKAREAGHTVIKLYTNERMVENIAFYGRRGYQETHREDFNGLKRVHMAKTLQAHA